ncbi:hypothetical protein Tco_0298353 [Tanacetum coccineum]
MNSLYEGVPTAKPSLEAQRRRILQKDNFTPLPEVPWRKGERESREDYTSLYAELGLSGSDTESDEEMPSVVRCGLKTKGQAEDQTLVYAREGQVIPEDPVSSTGTLSSLQHLAKDFSFGDQFLNDKPSEADNEKTTADTEAESMVSVTIQQDISVFPPMTSPVIGPSDPILIKRMGELEEFIANLVEENQALETRLDKQGSRINKLETMDLPKMIREQTVEFIDSQEIDRKINESVKMVVISTVKACHDSIRRDESEDFDVDKAQEETKKKSKQDSPNTPPGSPPSPPPPPPPPSGASGASGTTEASDSAQAPPPPPPSSSTHHGGQSTSTRPQVPQRQLLQLNTLLGQRLTQDQASTSQESVIFIWMMKHAV